MLLSALLLALPVPTPAASGDLDPSFDGDGGVLTDFGGFERVNALIVQPDGKLVAVGDNFSDVVLARYDSGGALDRSFGSAGHVVTDFGGVDSAEALVVQSDGKLVVAGTTNDSLNAILARFNRDGSLDPSFGVGGRVVVTEACCVYALVLQPDGKLVLGASSLVRLNSDGMLDKSFGRDGVESDISFFFVFGSALVLQPDGKLVRAGTVDLRPVVSCCQGFALVRFNPDGSLDKSFGSGGPFGSRGLVVTDLGEPSDVHALVLQTDGKLVAAGALGAVDQNPDQRVLVRYHPDGRLDTSFGTGGVVVTDGGSSMSGWLDLAVQTPLCQHNVRHLSLLI